MEELVASNVVGIIDLDGLESDLLPEDLGNEDAEQELPSGATPFPSLTEQMIIDRCQHEASTHKASCESLLRHLAENRTTLDVAPVLDAMRSLPGNLTNELENLRIVYGEDLRDKQTRKSNAHKELKSFKQKNQLRRNARPQGSFHICWFGG